MRSILIIDDDAQIRGLLKDMLNNQGYSVFEAEDGDQGISLCRNRAIHLVILDILMPKKDGLETIRELQATFPTIKVLAMSGGYFNASIDVLHMAKKLGATQILEKPFSLDGLLNAVTDIFLTGPATDHCSGI